MKKLSQNEEKFLISKIVDMFEKFDFARQKQLRMIDNVKNAIYNEGLPNSQKSWHSRVELPDVYELAQTLKSHICENIFSNPESMFDVSGQNLSAQKFANAQKAMLVNVLENMKFSNSLDKIVDDLVETGETAIFVGWKNEYKKIRRAQTFEEQLFSPTKDGYVIEKKLTYDAPYIQPINPKNFVFDTSRKENWSSCPKIYRTYLDPHIIKNNVANNYLNADKSRDLINMTVDKNDISAKNVFEKQVEILEFWGDISLENGEILEDVLITIAGRKHLIRAEINPFVINPFVYTNLIEDPYTQRGISPLSVSLIFNSLASEILNKQLDALSLIINPPYLAPKGAFKGAQNITPGDIIEYDPSLMPVQPVALKFDSALIGWDFIKYFKSQTEAATGIFKNMAGALQPTARTATELNYTVSGQSARLNFIIEKFYKNLVMPTIERIADLLSAFKFGEESICIKSKGEFIFLEINDEIRNADYLYHYGDRRANAERKAKSKELFDIITTLSKMPSMAENVDWIECFKFALEQYGIENPENFLKNLAENTDKKNMENHVN